MAQDNRSGFKTPVRPHFPTMSLNQASGDRIQVNSGNPIKLSNRPIRRQIVHDRDYKLTRQTTA